MIKLLAKIQAQINYVMLLYTHSNKMYKPDQPNQMYGWWDTGFYINFGGLSISNKDNIVWIILCLLSFLL